MRRLPVIVLLLSAVPALADTVVITPSATVIPQGGVASFTIGVSPGTYVNSVTVTYAGEAGQDVLYSPPYIASRALYTPALNKLVTVTVTYTNGAQPDVETTTIHVVNATLTGPTSVMRGWPATYTCRAYPAGVSMQECKWTYGVNTYEDTDGNDVSTWGGIMVYGDTLHCTAKVLGVTFNLQQTVTVNNRNWTTPILCVQDNDPDYGAPPTPEAFLGENRDRESNLSIQIFVPRSGDNFAPAVTRAKVTSGPCKDWWYVTSTTLKCDRETVINKYIKPNGPLLAGYNFYTANLSCFDSSAFLEAIKHHEYRGTPELERSPAGHQGRIEFVMQLFGYDPRKHIEPLCRRSEAELLVAINNVVITDEAMVYEFASQESPFAATGPNWGNGPTSLGSGGSTRWMGSNWSFDCLYGPFDF